jgi:hypothetical protein
LLISKTRTRLLFKSSLSKSKFLREGLKEFKAQSALPAQPEVQAQPAPLGTTEHLALKAQQAQPELKAQQARPK